MRDAGAGRSRRLVGVGPRVPGQERRQHGRAQRQLQLQCRQGGGARSRLGACGTGSSRSSTKRWRRCRPASPTIPARASATASSSIAIRRRRRCRRPATAWSVDVIPGSPPSRDDTRSARGVLWRRRRGSLDAAVRHRSSPRRCRSRTSRAGRALVHGAGGCADGAPAWAGARGRDRRSSLRGDGSERVGRRQLRDWRGLVGRLSGESPRAIGSGIGVVHNSAAHRPSGEVGRAGAVPDVSASGLVRGPSHSRSGGSARLAL